MLSQVRNGHTTLANVLRKYPVAGMADDKSGQMETVLNLIIKQGVFSFSMVSNEVDYYFHKLGALNTLSVVAVHCLLCRLDLSAVWSQRRPEL